MKKILDNVICVFIKEWWQVATNKKLFFTTLGVSSIMPLIIAFKGENSLLPIEYLRMILPIAASFLASQNIMQTIIIDEINFKTLDILVTSQLSKFSIIIGKVLLGVVFGVSSTIISLILLYIASLFSPYLVDYQFISMFNIIGSIEIASFASLISIMVALIGRNIQAMTFINMVVVLSVIFIIYKLTASFGFSMGQIGIIISIVCSLLVYFNMKLISMKNYTVRK